MAIIAGSTIKRHLSPRLVTLPVATLSATVDDVQDTLQDMEDDELSMPWPKLRSTSGGQDLGGGVTVGLTMELDNTQLAFARTASIESGTVTTADTLGVTLTDSLATFVTNGVVRGDWVLNFSDQSVTEVIVVDSETQLTCNVLSDGTLDQFTFGDAYKVWNVSEAQLEGGNFVAIDSVDAALNPVFPTFGRFISKASASSSTSTDAAALLRGTFNGGVYWDATNGKAAITDATIDGNEENQLLNQEDVYDQASSLGFTNMYLTGATTTIATGSSLEGHHFIGISPINTFVTIDTLSDTTKCIFENMNVGGIADSPVIVRQCIIRGATLQGGLRDCTLRGVMILLAGTSTFVDCIDGEVSPATEPSIDMTTAGTQVTVTGYAGDLSIANCTDANSKNHIGGDGRLTIDATCTAGTFTVFGNMDIINNGGSAVVIINQTPAAKVKKLQYLIENLEPDTAKYGDIYFVDPVNGDDTREVTSQELGWKTLAYAESQIKDNNGDIILIIAQGSAVVTIDERLVSTKSNFAIRGQNLLVHIHPTTGTGATLQLSGDNVGLANLSIKSFGGTSNCVEWTNADYSVMHNVRVENSVGIGVVYNGCEKGNFHNSFVGYSTSHGLQYIDCRDMSVNDNCHVDTNMGNGIDLPAVTTLGDTHEVIIKNTIIHESGGYGVSIGANVETTQIHDSVKFINNVSGNVLDGGVTTYYDNSSLTTTSIADAVWADTDALTVPKFIGLS